MTDNNTGFYFTNHNTRLACHHQGNPNSPHMLICLHGLASNATRWDEFIEHTSLRESMELFAMDLRGHGRSMTFRRFTRADWIDDIHCLIQQRDKSAILVGHSMGAQIALDYASQYAEQADLDGLVLIDPVFPEALTGVLKKVARFRQLINVATFILRGFYRLGLHKRQYPYRDLRALDNQTREFLANNPHKTIAELYMNPFADLAYIPYANYLQDLYEVTRPLQTLRRIHVPVLVLLSQGASTSHVDINRRILGELSQLDIRTIDADHWLLTEKPVEARQEIEQWCHERVGL